MSVTYRIAQERTVRVKRSMNSTTISRKSSTCSLKVRPTVMVANVPIRDMRVASKVDLTIDWRDSVDSHP